MNVKRDILNYLILLFIFILFIVQVVFLLPSPYGDSSNFLELSFNICRENLFTRTNTGENLRISPIYRWVEHGWFYQYLMAKFNLFCSLRGIFLFNFLLIFLTSFFGYKILSKLEKNYTLIIFVLLLICLLQISLQFRLEVFTIFISVLLIYFFNNNYKFLIGVLFAILFYSQPVIMCFLGLFSLFFYNKKIFKNFLPILFGFFIFFLLLTYIYPYSLMDYINGIYSNRYTWLAGTAAEFILTDLYKYYVIPKFIPFWGFLFLIIISSAIYKNYYVLLSLPFLIFFGPRMPMSNYVLIGITPFLLLNQYSILTNKDTFLLNLRKNIFFTILVATVVIGYSQYFSRNFLTVYFFNQELKKTTSFLSKNLNEINHMPTFGFMINKDLKLNKDEIKKGYIEINKPSINVYSVNGIKNPCPSKNINYVDPSINIFGYKIFNSNAGYGIWVCKIDK